MLHAIHDDPWLGMYKACVMAPEPGGAFHAAAGRAMVDSAGSFV